MNNRDEKFIEAAETGDLAAVREMLDGTKKSGVMGAISAKLTGDAFDGSLDEYDRNRALAAAACEGRGDVVDYLIPVSDPTFNHSQPLREAAARGHASIVETLIPHSEPNAAEGSALRTAAQHGHLSVVELLLPHSDATEWSSGAIREAAIGGHKDIVDYLYSSSDVDEALKFVEEKDKELPCVNYLQNRRQSEIDAAQLQAHTQAPTGSQAEEGFTSNGLFDEVAGPLPEAIDPIYRASLVRDEKEVVRLLDAHRLAHGDEAQIAYANRLENRQDDEDEGMFPFKTIAVERSDELKQADADLFRSILYTDAMTRDAIERGADVNARDKFNETPLHTAARRQEYKQCELLIESGADVRAKNNDGDNPLDLAKYAIVKAEDRLGCIDWDNHFIDSRIVPYLETNLHRQQLQNNTADIDDDWKPMAVPSPNARPHTQSTGQGIEASQSPRQAHVRRL